MRRRLLPLALIAAGAATLLTLPAQAAEPLQTVTGVAGTSGSVQRLALSPDGSTGYIVDGSARLAIFDTATSAVVAHSIDFAVEGFGLPTDVAISPDGRTLYVGVGSNSNVGENGIANETDRAAVLEMAQRVERLRDDVVPGGAAQGRDHREPAGVLLELRVVEPLSRGNGAEPLECVLNCHGYRPHDGAVWDVAGPKIGRAHV